MPSQDQLMEDVYAREVVMARVGHLIRRKQQEVERITRILRAAPAFEGVAAPVPGEIQKIVLIGPYATQLRPLIMAASIERPKGSMSSSRRSVGLS